MVNKRPLVALTSIAAASLILAGCSQSGGTTASGVNVVTKGKLSVCTHLPFEPMEYKDDSGNVVGFEIDIMNLLAAHLGVTTQIVEVDMAQITSGAAFAAKKCDIAAAGMTITDARKQAISFSEPYFGVTQSVATKQGAGIASFADLKGKKIAVETDSTGQEWANKNADQYGFETVIFDDSATTLGAVLSGRADASIFDNTYTYLFVHDNATITVGFEIQTGEVYGFGASLDDNGKALIDQTNTLLNKMNSDGTYLRLYKQWVDENATSASLPTS